MPTRPKESIQTYEAEYDRHLPAFELASSGHVTTLDDLGMH